MQIIIRKLSDNKISKQHLIIENERSVIYYVNK